MQRIWIYAYQFSVRPSATAAANAAMQSWAVVLARRGNGSSNGSHFPRNVIMLRLSESVTLSGVRDVNDMVLRPLIP